MAPAVLKTGFTEKAGSVFAGAVQRDGKILYSIVLDSSTEAQRFTDATTLDDWVYDNTIDYPLVHSGGNHCLPTSSGTTATGSCCCQHKSFWVDGQNLQGATLSDPTASVRCFHSMEI